MLLIQNSSPSTKRRRSLTTTSSRSVTTALEYPPKSNIASKTIFKDICSFEYLSLLTIEFLNWYERGEKSNLTQIPRKSPSPSRMHLFRRHSFQISYRSLDGSNVPWILCESSSSIEKCRSLPKDFLQLFYKRTTTITFEHSKILCRFDINS